MHDLDEDKREKGGGVEEGRRITTMRCSEYEKIRRTSSLIAGRDAELFVALGEALGDGGAGVRNAE